MHLCTCVSEEGCDGEAACSETPSLLSYTLTYKSTHGLVVYYGLADFLGKEKKRKQKSRSPKHRKQEQRFGLGDVQKRTSI
jgi:hypothetical protein